MAELKQSRWVKIHEPGNANFDEKDNIMDIVVGSNRCQAEATFTVRSFRKAAYWLDLRDREDEPGRVQGSHELGRFGARHQESHRQGSEEK